MAFPDGFITRLERLRGLAILPDKPEETPEVTLRALWHAAAGAPLSVRLPENSSIRVIGGNGDGFAVTVCKFARRADSLEAIHVTADGPGIAFRGPSSREWMAFLIVRAPRNAALDLEAMNGSIGVKDVTGRVTARTTNGPIDLEGCSGSLDANAVNGPITLERCSGTGAARAVMARSIFPEAGEPTSWRRRTVPFPWRSRAIAGRGARSTAAPSTARST